MLSVAKLRLEDLEKKERQLAEHVAAATNGKRTFGDAMEIYRLKLTGDASSKRRTRE